MLGSKGWITEALRQRFLAQPGASAALGQWAPGRASIVCLILDRIVRLHW
jgi:hypothetical protein